MPQSALVNWLFSWKKPKATPPVVAARFPSPIESVLEARVEELENDNAGINARLDRLEDDLRRLRELSGFA